MISHLMVLPDGAADASAWMSTLDGVLLRGAHSARGNPVIGELPANSAGSPLADSVAQATDALNRSSVHEEHIVALAAARAAVTGALYDSLRAHVQASLGRPPSPAPTTLTGAAPTTDSAARAARAWLADVVTRGFARVDAELVAEARPRPQRCTAFLGWAGPQRSWAHLLVCLKRHYRLARPTIFHSDAGPMCGPRH